MKNAVIVFFVTAFWFSFAVTLTAQSLRFGLKAGAGVAKFDYEPTPPADTFSSDFYAGLSYDRANKFRPTFLVAGVLEYDLSKDFFLSTGLQSCLKFSKVERDLSLSVNNDFNMHVLYLQMPLNVHYRAGKFFLGAGGYAGLGIGGKWNAKIFDDGELIETLSDQLKFGKKIEVSNLKRFDAGLRAEIGFGLKTIRLSIAYDYGMVNNLNQWANDKQVVYKSKLHHQALYATATYYWLAK